MAKNVEHFSRISWLFAFHVLRTVLNLLTYLLIRCLSFCCSLSSLDTDSLPGVWLEGLSLLPMTSHPGAYSLCCAEDFNFT